MSIGLVLSGGGAKGAYQIGVLKALAEMNIEINKISGASIGSLNGVIVASSKTTVEAATKLDNIWQELSKHSPIQINNKNITFIFAKTLSKLLTRSVDMKPFGTMCNMAFDKYAEKNNLALHLLDDSPIINLFDRYVDFDDLYGWKDIWVSVFKGSVSSSLIEFFKGEFLRLDTAESIFVKLQDLKPAERAQAILASSALPILYPARHLKVDSEGDYFFDGGIGGARNSQGNTPITPLVKDVSCDTIIVTHLDNGSYFSRKDFTGNIIDIRPQHDLVATSKGKLKSMLDFSADKIAYLKDCGYQDTLYAFKSLKDFSVVKREIDVIQNEVDDLLLQL